VRARAARCAGGVGVVWVGEWHGVTACRHHVHLLAPFHCSLLLSRAHAHACSTRRVLTAFFKERACETLVRPVDDEATLQQVRARACARGGLAALAALAVPSSPSAPSRAHHILTTILHRTFFLSGGYAARQGAAAALPAGAAAPAQARAGRVGEAQDDGRGARVGPRARGARPRVRRGASVTGAAGGCLLSHTYAGVPGEGVFGASTACSHSFSVLSFPPCTRCRSGHQRARRSLDRQRVGRRHARRVPGGAGGEERIMERARAGCWMRHLAAPNVN
jgi:hypothetical protein